MGKSFEIAVYQTTKLENYCYDTYGDSSRAQDRAKTFIEGAFSKSNHTCTVHTPSTDISAPQEETNSSFDATYPCSSMTGTFSNLAGWWDARIENCSDLSHTADADLLLTNDPGESGVAIGNQTACSEGGPNIADLPSSYELYGCSQPYNSMQTALHELAHCLLDGKNGGFDEHKVGNVYDHFSGSAKTPMATPGESNECGNYVSSADNCWEMRWSDCCESKMENL